MGRTWFYHWLSGRPPVLYYAALPDDDIGLRLPDRLIYRLPISFWHQTADDIECYHLQAKARRPRHLLHHLVNEPDVALELRIRGVPATFVSHNAMLDERIFTVLEGARPRFDAVYNARMSPFKRHALARDVPSLLMIGSAYAPDDSAEYFEQVRAALPQAHFTHAGGPRWISAEEVAAALNSARVGLCLSASEGAMYSATEYLLCGLPVVSTASQGGRDAWFDTRYVRVVRDDPRSVAGAVAELIALNLPPRWVRQQALRTLWEHRRRFIAIGQEIYDREQTGRDFARDFYANFLNKLGHWRDLDDLSRLMPSVPPESGIHG